VFTLLNTDQYHALFIIAVQNDVIVIQGWTNPDLQVTVGSIFYSGAQNRTFFVLLFSCLEFCGGFQNFGKFVYRCCRRCCFFVVSFAVARSPTGV